MAKEKNISKLHVPHNKNTADCVPVRVQVPEEVVIPMDMSSGDAAIPCVNVGDHVYVGQLIANEGERWSSPVYASVSGTVSEIKEIVRGQKSSPKGTVQAICIKSDGLMEKDPSLEVPVVNNADEFLAAIRKSGIVGLGGAAFPTWAKLNEMKNDQYKVDTVLINAAECEPYITSDNRMMIDHTDLIVKGVDCFRKYLSEYLTGAKYMICVEKNKPEAIACLKEAFAGQDDVIIHELDAIFPQGAKQVMLYNATGRVAIAGKRFPSFGAIIINVSSIAKIGEYMTTGMPLVERIVTVDGPAVENPGNYIAPIGTKTSYLLAQTGLKAEVGKVVFGGPMNGNAVSDVDDPIVKISNCILVFDEKNACLPAPTDCIHCGRCVNVCPVSINVWEVEQAMEWEDESVRYEKLFNTGIRQCVDCASCAYVCPAHRRLLQSNKNAKRWMKGYEKQMKEGVTK